MSQGTRSTKGSQYSSLATDDTYKPLFSEEDEMRDADDHQSVTPRSAASAQYGITESQQYEPEESEVWWHHQLQRHFEDRGSWWSFTKRTDTLRWVLTFATGLLTGVVAILITFFTKSITNFKFDTFYFLVSKEQNDGSPFGMAFFFLLLCNALFAIVAWYMVHLEPLVTGSGIPEVKCYLNGLSIPRLVRFKTMLCKAVGIVFSCSAGLPVGKESSLVHVGSVIAAGVSQGKSTTMGMDTSFTKYQDFRNDREKRDFVACGTAAGVAAAFGAPIGGVLFSLEEGASFWSTKLTWRCFFCAMTTVFALTIMSTADSLFGHSESAAMFSFGEFFSLQDDESNYSAWELFLFVCIGAMGGLIGASFNYCVLHIFGWRRENVATKPKQFWQVIIVVCVMSTIAFMLPFLWKTCTPLPINMDGWTTQEKQLVEELVPLYCPETHYNELASLYLTDSGTVIRQIFHFREVGDHNEATFSSAALCLFFLPYIIMACVTYGIAVPAGMFVPSLTSGAVFGRLIGHLLHRLDNTRGTFADSGTYALMGAAAIQAGISRMTISLTVMILEATGDMQYVLPLMLVVMAARLVGNIFNDGIYDLHIHCAQLDYLDEDEQFSKEMELHDLTVCEMMTKRPRCMYPLMRVGECYDTLRAGKHHCYPVLEDKNSQVLLGTMTRKVLCTILQHRAFGAPHADPKREKRLSPLVNWSTLECIYPRYPDVEQLAISDIDRECWLDIRPYLDSSPYSINEHASVQRAYRMFRTLGLRHLCVVDKHNQLLGIVSRADFVNAQHIHARGGNGGPNGNRDGSGGSRGSGSSGAYGGTENKYAANARKRHHYSKVSDEDAAL